MNKNSYILEVACTTGFSSRELAEALRKTFAASGPEKEDTKKAILRPAFAL